MSTDGGPKSQNRYQAVIEHVFSGIYAPGAETLEFARDDLSSAAQQLGIELPKNLGDVVYSIRYRTSMPAAVLATQPEGYEWIIEGAGRSRYAFKLVRVNRIAPNPSLLAVKIPDATPEIVRAHALSDEQALLAVVRYNRLIDVFLGIVTYSLQNHLRTTVRAIGQVEIDEIYVGLDRHGRQFVLPVQAKGGSDQLSVVQTKQDIACCAEKYPTLICRPVSSQFLADDLIALFELALADGEVKVVEERHYRLVPAQGIDAADLAFYAQRG